MTAHRTADVLYNSEAALRLVISELGELRRRNTPRGTFMYDGAPPSGADDDARLIDSPAGPVTLDTP